MKYEARRHGGTKARSEGQGSRHKRFDHSTLLPHPLASRLRVFVPSCLLLIASFAWAEPTQDDVIHSISESFGNTVDPARLLAGAAVVVAAILLIAVLNQRRKRRLAPRVGEVV